MPTIGSFESGRTFYDSILLSWTEEIDATVVKIVRRIKDFPYTINDGALVYYGPGSWGFFEDKDVQDATWYYYQLYYWDEGESIFKTDVSLRSISLAIRKVNFPLTLKKNIPTMYNSPESVGSEDDPYSWQTIRDEIFGLLFEEVYGLLRAFPSLFDLDKCPPDALDGLTKLVGIVPNKELSITRRREEARAAVDIWRSKGTEVSIKRAIKAISGQEADIDLWVDNLIILGNGDRKTIDFSDVSEMQNYGRLGHTTCHLLSFDTVNEDSWYNTFSFGLYINFVGGNTELSQEVVRKLRRIIEDQIPVFKKLHLLINSVLVDIEEVYPYPVLDTFTDGMMDSYFEAPVSFGPPMVCGKLDSLTTKLKSRSAIDTSQKYVLDSWYDIINVQ